MPGFLTHYLLGMESCDALSDNYIQNLIRSNNHAFLIGLQGSDLLSFNPHSLSKRGLSYRTTSNSLRNQESAALFYNMLDYILNLHGSGRDACIAYMAGYLCFYAIDQLASPYILYQVWQDLPSKCNASRMATQKHLVETTIDTILLRNHCHMEPSQLNFEALTFIGKSDLEAISKMMRYTIQTTYHYRISPSELANGLRNLRRMNIYLEPDSKIKRIICKTLVKTSSSLPIYQKKIYEDFLQDKQGYMNEEEHPWYPYPGCPQACSLSFEEIFTQSLISSRSLLEDLDSCLAWGMDSEALISDIINLSAY